MNALAKCPNLSMVETLTSAKLASKLNNQVKTGRLPVLIQVNTSGEENKNGVEPSDTVQLVRHVKDKCDKLVFAGLMTIGALGRSLAAKEEVSYVLFVTVRPQYSTFYVSGRQPGF